MAGSESSSPLTVSIALGLVISFHSPPPVIIETAFLGLVAMLLFGLFEQWPKRSPRGCSWVLQVMGVALARFRWARS